jgi:predicted house-cleaning noncanonical NTP pyrophosphatase (MazG superfamily)
VLDGQQRTISIGQYVNGDFSISFNGRIAMFHNLTKEEQNKILDYELMIYFCEGTDKERLDWFRIINIAGEKLTDQEIRNAVYTGPWLSDAKLKFSKSNCAAYLLANDGGQLVSGSPIRQEYLETALSWINEEKIEDYMAEHQHDKNAEELWEYFQNVIAWVREVFMNYRREMSDVQWGLLYNEFKGKKFDSKKLEKEIAELMQDEDVTKKSGIYPYVLTRNEKFLNIRAFTEKQKRETYEKQKGKCAKCKKHFEIEEMEADHITPWHEGGKTISKNCQMLCKEDNRTKSGK